MWKFVILIKKYKKRSDWYIAFFLVSIFVGRQGWVNFSVWEIRSQAGKGS